MPKSKPKSKGKAWFFFETTSNGNIKGKEVKLRKDSRIIGSNRNIYIQCKSYAATCNAKNAILAMLCIEGIWIKVAVLKLFEQNNMIKYFDYQNNNAQLMKLSAINELVYVNQIVKNRSILPNSINEHDGCFESKQTPDIVQILSGSKNSDSKNKK